MAKLTRFPKGQGVGGVGLAVIAFVSLSILFHRSAYDYCRPYIRYVIDQKKLERSGDLTEKYRLGSLTSANCNALKTVQGEVLVGIVGEKKSWSFSKVSREIEREVANLRPRLIDRAEADSFSFDYTTDVKEPSLPKLYFLANGSADKYLDLLRAANQASVKHDYEVTFWDCSPSETGYRYLLQALAKAV